MPRYRFTVAYDGTHYAGWQVQPERTTIQEVLETLLKDITKSEAPIKVHGSGRTDSGVHARGQVCHVDLDTRMTPESLLKALNSRLPPDIRIHAAARAPATFHARRTAKGKEYRYTVWNAQIMPPQRRLYALHNYYKLNLHAMRQAAAHCVGEHDFAAFAAAGSVPQKSTVRTIYALTINKRGPELTFRVSGSGFMYKMVRSLVGYLLQVGRGAEHPDTLQDLLANPRPRKARIPSAPPHGLTLWRVWYR